MTASSESSSKAYQTQFPIHDSFLGALVSSESLQPDSRFIFLNLTPNVTLQRISDSGATLAAQEACRGSEIRCKRLLARTFIYPLPRASSWCRVYVVSISQEAPPTRPDKKRCVDCCVGPQALSHPIMTL
jgi:hypothetical protein